MIGVDPQLQQLWDIEGFTPNTNQREAILHIDGPLYLPAGPGSGKTRVLLWRTLNLIFIHNVPPEEIFLSTFTEKAALQLREGLRNLLGLVTKQTGKTFDISRMYVGTIHALCQRLLLDRRFYPKRQRGRTPQLLDELGQYFHIYGRRRWGELTASIDFGPEPNRTINLLFGTNSDSRHAAVTNCITLFNRLSEECIDPLVALTLATDPTLQKLLEVYRRYRASLEDGKSPKTDFSLLQQQALNLLDRLPDAGNIFQHVIVDEYQDTNTIQERLFFRLAAGHKNLCVVGDDDQALYRFRGATVDNFVEFPNRCQLYWQIAPRKIPLAINYRSRKRIVEFYTDFIPRADWSRPGGGNYRVTDKNISANSVDAGPSVVASTAGTPEAVAQEIAALVKQLLDSKKVENANQIAFLFPSLKYQGAITTQVKRMKEALETAGLRVYAPRAGRLLEIDEATALFGVYLHIFNKPARGAFPGHDYATYHNWIDTAYVRGDELIRADRHLSLFVRDKQNELKQAAHDYEVLAKVAERLGWLMTEPYSIPTMKRPLYSALGLSDRAKRSIASPYFEKIGNYSAASRGMRGRLAKTVVRAARALWPCLRMVER